MKPSSRTWTAAAAFGGISALLAWQAGADTWGRESVALLQPSLAARFAESTPLPGPIYNGDVVLYALLGGVTLFAAGRVLWMLARVVAPIVSGLLRGRRPNLGQSGQAMTEVAVSFPILLITTLILMQLALLYQAKNVVTYAAFSATRAAIVWIPIQEGSEQPNVINTDGGDKYDKVHQAAAMACVPISPRASVVLDSIPFVGDIVASAFDIFEDIFSSLGLAGEMVDNAIQRYAFSSFATSLTFYQADENGLEEMSGEATWTYPEGADVGVKVTHRYYLPIPLANRIIGDTWSLIDLGPIFSLDLPGQYKDISSRVVLPLEGVTGNPPITGFWD
jgi:hypothetical protein